MGRLYLEHSLSNQSAVEVAGSGNAPKGLKPLNQPQRRFNLGGLP
jgi:hypothetical protein